MRKRVKVKKLGRTRDARKALLKSLVLAILNHGKIETSLARAKVVKGFLDSLAKGAKRENLASKRKVASLLSANKSQVKKAVEKLKQTKQGSVARIIKLGKRTGDNSPRARIELLIEKEETKPQPAPKA